MLVTLPTDASGCGSLWSWTEGRSWRNSLFDISGNSDNFLGMQVTDGAVWLFICLAQAFSPHLKLPSNVEHRFVISESF